MSIEFPLRPKQQDIQFLSASNLVIFAMPSIPGFVVASGKLNKSFLSHRAFHFLLELMYMYTILNFTIMITMMKAMTRFYSFSRFKNFHTKKQINLYCI